MCSDPTEDCQQCINLCSSGKKSGHKKKTSERPFASSKQNASQIENKYDEFSQLNNFAQANVSSPIVAWPSRHRRTLYEEDREETSHMLNRLDRNDSKNLNVEVENDASMQRSEATLQECIECLEEGQLPTSTYHECKQMKQIKRSFLKKVYKENGGKGTNWMIYLAGGVQYHGQVLSME